MIAHTTMNCGYRLQSQSQSHCTYSGWSTGSICCLHCYRYCLFCFIANEIENLALVSNWEREIETEAQRVIRLNAILSSQIIINYKSSVVSSNRIFLWLVVNTISRIQSIFKMYYLSQSKVSNSAHTQQHPRAHFFMLVFFCGN